MKILITGGRVIDPKQNIDAIKDVLLKDGVIAAIEDPGKIPAAGAECLEARGKIVSPGFIDLHSHLREPGAEYKETIQSGTAAAVHGGFTAVCCMANTQPVNDNASVTEFILRKAAQTGYCRVYPIGAITKSLKGEELATIAELKQAGCVAISDDGLTVQNAQLMRIALEYARSFDLPVSTHSIEANLAQGGHMNESFAATRLGISGSPAVAEDIIIARDLMLAEASGAHLHIGHLSTVGGIDMVRAAKKRGIRVTCEVAPHHFSLTDEDIKNYDTNYKMCPPLRSKKDVAAIRAAFREGGIIDAIATDHAPHGVIDKEVEFDRAAFGILGFETALPLSLCLVEEGFISLNELVRLLTARPAEVFKLPGGSLVIGSPADVTVFDPSAEWIYSRENIFSKSKNSPYLGKKLKGKIEATIVAGKIRYSAEKGLIT